MKLTQTQRDKIYKLIAYWMYDNIYSMKWDGIDYDFIKRGYDGKLQAYNTCLNVYESESVDCDSFIHILKVKHPATRLKEKYMRRLNFIKKSFKFCELIDMPSKTLKDYYDNVKPQYINYLENHEEFPLESIQVGFYI